MNSFEQVDAELAVHAKPIDGPTSRLSCCLQCERWRSPPWQRTFQSAAGLAWPFSVEAFSGVFDFNHAPFFSELEVRVERSKRRVVLILNGVDGPLRWRDLQASKTLFPGGARPDDPVEFIIQMDGQ